MCVSLYFGTGGAFPLFVWSFSQNSEPRGTVSTTFCYKPSLLPLIISFVTISLPNAWTNFHTVAVRGFLFISFYRVGYWGSERHTILLRSHIRWGEAWVLLERCLIPKPVFCTACGIRWFNSANASAKPKQPSLLWKGWLKSSAGMLCLLSWMLVWITLHSLETMEILSTSHLQMQYQVKAANYCPSGRKLVQPFIRDLFKFLASQWMWIFESHLHTWGRYCWRHLACVCVHVRACAQRGKALNVCVCHSKSKTSVTIAFICWHENITLLALK